MKSHPVFCWGLLALLVAVSAAGAFRLHYKEDIGDFLPVDADYRRSLAIYQDIAGGSKIAVQFSLSAPETALSPRADSLLPAAMEHYAAALRSLDTARWLGDVATRVSLSDMMDVMGFCYARLPYLLAPGDLDEANVGDTAWVRSRLAQSYRLLTSQAGSLAGQAVDSDPLGLFAPVGKRLQLFRPAMAMNLRDGYVFSDDGTCAYLSLVSPFGNSETDGNARLAALLEAAGDSLHAVMPEVECHAVGAPLVAVENARRIKLDSLLALAIASLLILAALIRRFRTLRPMLSIVMATGFGYLFAVGTLGWSIDSLSVIVLGIASMLIGIAVNYPLHYECHLQEHPDPSRTLRDLTAPLVIGNVTTVGAFLALVPLPATALRDLGLFAALMLAGTILFTLVWLPQMPTGKHSAGAEAAVEPSMQPLPRSARPLLQPFGMKQRLGWVVLIAGTVVFGWLSSRTAFDADFTHINYMRPEVREDMQRLAAVEGQARGVAVYAIVEDNNAATSLRLQQILDSLSAYGGVSAVRNPALLLPDADEQQRRLSAWHRLWQEAGYVGADGTLGEGWNRMMEIAEETGFSTEAFEGFRSLLTDPLPLLGADDFAPLRETVVSQYVKDGRLLVQVTVPDDGVESVETALRAASPGGLRVFDQPSLNARIATNLTDSFNWIGFVCGAIVFVFLWLSFRRLEVALIAFLPMVIGWIWILGIMQLLGLQFNIVNVILATFIFGQGDDYTIFVTEGLLRDYRTGSSTTSASYLRSIRLSAFIMLAGMGALVFARHPAMHSLGEITLIGMGVVFVMALTLPPMLFRLFLEWKPFLKWMNR